SSTREHERSRGSATRSRLLESATRQYESIASNHRGSRPVEHPYSAAYRRQGPTRKISIKASPAESACLTSVHHGEGASVSAADYHGHCRSGLSVEKTPAG